MTEKELEAIEIICDANDGEKYIEACTDMTPACRKLIAEVRRLRAALSVRTSGRARLKSL